MGYFQRIWSGVRNYRFAGEQANHAQQLQETRAAIAGMEAEAADPNITPERRFWLNKHREGMENRLAEMEGKPRLTSEEMNERDAIETHLYGAPLPRGRLARVRGFLTPLAASGPWALILGLLGNPVTWVTIGLAAFGVQTARIDRLHHDLAHLRQERDAPCSEAETTLHSDGYHTSRQACARVGDLEASQHAYQGAIVAAQQAARTTTATLEAERARVRAAILREQRRQRDIAQVTNGGPAPDWDSSLRNAPTPEDQPGPAAPAPVNNPR